MTDNEKFNLVLSKLDIIIDKVDVLEADVKDLKADVQELKNRVSKLELHIENATDKNIQLLAENFVELTNKLNRAIPVHENNLAYEVKVNYLLEEVDKLKQEVEKIIVKIA